AVGDLQEVGLVPFRTVDLKPVAGQSLRNGEYGIARPALSGPLGLRRTCFYLPRNVCLSCLLSAHLPDPSCPSSSPCAPTIRVTLPILDGSLPPEQHIQRRDRGLRVGPGASKDWRSCLRTAARSMSIDPYSNPVAFYAAEMKRMRAELGLTQE